MYQPILQRPFFLTKNYSMFCTLIFRSGARFSKGPETFLARRQIYKTCSTVPSLQPVKFASFTDSFIVSLSKLLKPFILNVNTANTKQVSAGADYSWFLGPKSYRDFRQTDARPQACKNFIIITYIRTPTRRFFFFSHEELSILFIRN